MSKEEFFKKYKEIILKTNGGNDDYVVAICQISNLINEFANEQEKQITDLQAELEMFKKAFYSAIIELDFRQNHSQTTNDECLKRIEELKNEILNRVKGVKND